ncbi:MAG: DUF885 domain-containing protein [Vicinamibacteria bacterium]
MKIRIARSWIVLAAALAPVAGAQAQATVAPPPRPAWIERSDANARLVLEVSARFSPESAGRLGIEGLDEMVLDLKPQVYERTQQATRDVLATLEQRLASENDAAVRQDLEILVRATKDTLEENELEHRYELDYTDIPLTVFRGLRALLDDQVPAVRRAKALVRLRRYAGLEPGYTPIATLAEQRARESFGRDGVRGPYRVAVEKNLGNSASYVKGIGELFDKYKLAGYQPALARLTAQMTAYDAFVRAEVLPRARADFRLQPDLYAFSLRQFGVDIPPDQLADRARVAFVEIRNEMRTLAPLVAREKGVAVTDYREMIRELKKNQLVGEAILPHYQKRMRDLEEIIRRERIITLPAREARIRLASEAESAAIPAPNMRPPRLIGNTGEMGEFVLPLRVPTTGADGKQTVKGFDDFTFDAASWTLTVHEGRPGHELQFASVIEKGVSTARAVFAANSVNIEGWALYAEAEMKPYEPLDGQLIALQHRLLRAARAFLDPDLQAGRITPEAATQFLMDEVVLSEAAAQSEVERYTFRAPGQATSYFYGYFRWMQMKAETEMALGPRFERQRYHDFLLAQGLLPPSLIAEAVKTEFVPAEAAR